ncbi:diguanylate cyclase (GGDEF)-like protein [Motilibacter rhizosphaerae]|uniref:Diguanylate cyclase (GGDEF)-like protein n=1 Tax=Motilibacter rhizosphaerae TaxID=598652 RepID=A0A4Q7NQH6_9ACTN|nr:sensor domain-containing phosphodiesterase [Motilibacter rhizosphaerae]RZS87473.1 diguanylate cyclase (GGDEF)-like protein [Motilibacter rhizosphaerae]
MGEGDGSVARVPPAPPDHRGFARAVGWLYAAGPTTYVVWSALSRSPGSDLVADVALAVMAVLLAAVLLSGRLDRASRGLLERILLVYPAVLAASAYAGVRGGAPWFGFGFVPWGVPVAFATVERARAWVHAGWSSLCATVGLLALAVVGAVRWSDAVSSAAAVDASAVALAVLTGWLHRRETERATQQRVLAEFGRRALVETDLARLFEDAMATALELVPGELGMLLEHRRDEALVRVAASVRSERAGSVPPVGFTYPVAPGRPSWHVLESGEPLVVSDRTTDPRFPTPPPWDEALVSAIVVPVPGSDGPWGLLRVHSHVRREYTSEEAAVLTGLANLLAAALERVRIVERSAHAALHDALTGLPNRRWAMEELAARTARDDAPCVVLLDVDDFKDVNDAFGAGSGDSLLGAAAQRLSRALQPGESLARVDGDAFVVLATVPQGPEGEREGLALASRLRDAWLEPFDLGGRKHYLTACAGVALPRRMTSAPDEAAALLLGEAAAAIARAKQRGRGQVAAYDAGMRAWSVARVGLEDDLRRAMRNGEFSLDFQPVVDGPSGIPVGVEALLRWHSPTRGTVGPTEFIPVAERLGLIVPLGAWVLGEASRTVASWQRAGIEGPDGAPLRLAVNLSPVQLDDPDLPRLVASVLDTSGLAPGSLGLEVTEGVLLDDIESAAAALTALGDAGAHILLDDFGTGHSSLAYLHRFPLQAVKIDASFVARLGNDPAAEAIVAAVAQMARTLGLEVVAEGVEDASQRAQVAAHGVTRLQGFGIARPMPGDVTLDWLAAAPRPV